MASLDRTEELPAISLEEEGDDKALHRVLFVLLALALIAAPFVVYPIFLMKLLCFALFAAAFNLLLGYGGLLSFGHAAYFGMASYVCAYTLKYWPVGPEIAILIAVAASAAMGAVFGIVAIRRHGIYFAMITLAMAQMVYFFCVQSPRFTGGEDGIQGVPRGRLLGMLDLGNDLNLYAFVAVVFLLAMLLIHRIIHSPFGQVLKAIRDNEQRAVSLGYRIKRYKLLAFTLSAALAGLAGAMKAIVFQVATLVDVHWSMSGEPILMALIGGPGTIFGPLVGATVIVSMQNFLAQLGGWVTVIQGAIFVICVLLFREGIVGLIARWTKRTL